MVLGIIYGLFASNIGWVSFTSDWIKPWGTIFVNLLKLIAVPLVFASLIKGVASLSDVSRLSRIGGKTVFLYLTTTVIAVTIGLVLVNTVKPGSNFDKDTIQLNVMTYPQNQVFQNLYFSTKLPIHNEELLKFYYYVTLVFSLVETVYFEPFF